MQIKIKNPTYLLFINIISSTLSMLISSLISLVLTPYITKNIGAEAYGFVSLANNFINGASLLTIALNSMASRFVVIELYRGDINKAKTYYSSVFYANLCLASIIGLFSFIFVYRLEIFINISPALIQDVKLLFLMLFINFLVSIFSSLWGIGAFYTNKLYLINIINIGGYLIRGILMLGLYMLLPPRVSYIGIITLIVTVYVTIVTVLVNKKLLPELKVSRNYFEFKKVLVILKAGIWNSITKLGEVLLSGLDLLITNLFISQEAMGILAFAKTLPTIVSSIIGAVTNVFSPTLTEDYSKKNYENMKKNIEQSIKILGVFCSVTLSGLIVLGDIFFQLWVPEQNATLLHQLMILTVFGSAVNGVVNAIYNIFTVTNKLKFNSVLVILTGAVSTVLVFILLKFTDWGIFAVAGVSSILIIIKTMFFVVPYASKLIGQKYTVFFPSILKMICITVVNCIIGLIIRNVWFNNVAEWPLFLLSIIVIGGIDTSISVMILLTKEERKLLRKTFFRAK